MKRLALFMLLVVLMAAALPAAEVLYSGTLGTSGNTALKGSWEIVKRDDGNRVLVLGDDFRARRGPDLKIFFSTLPLKSIHNHNAGNRSYAVLIAPLKSSRGAQEYVLPTSLDLTKYTTWIVHCEAFAHFWDGAELIKK